MKLKLISSLAAAITIAGITPALAATPEQPQATGLGPWTTTPVFTIGETIDGYTPPGIPDGMGAFERNNTVEIVSNHELRSAQGYPYTLANGTELTGARISKLVFDKKTRQLMTMGPAYDTIYNRAGEIVDDPSDLAFNGLNRLCSAGSFTTGQAGFVDDIFLTGEETGGGTEFALDVANGELWAAPWMGRAAWESVAALEDRRLNRTHVAIVVGDDRGGAPLLLYVGKKQRQGNFLERNGLANGKLYMWVADNGDTTPAQWNGSNGQGLKRSGKFVEVTNYDASMAGQPGFDALGFADQANLDAQQLAIGAFRFSRPEDVHTNPAPGKGRRVVLASTGRSSLFPEDSWGTTYVIDFKINRDRIHNDNIEADITILYDGDAANNPDLGIRSPDNLVWADDGFIYIQEDRSIGGFGANGGGETSIWQLDPETGKAGIVGRVDRLAVPYLQVDIDPTDVGDWETSGIIDVTDEFNAKDERLLFFNVQAHSLRGDTIDSENLVQGGQFLFMSKPEDDDDDEYETKKSKKHKDDD